MKKMLFIGAMLIVGMTAFGGKSADLGPSTGPGPVSGDTSLGITTRGEVIDGTNRVMLVVKPTLNAGSDGTSIEFKYGDMKQGTSKEIPGEFTVEILKNNEPVPLGANEASKELAVDIYKGSTKYTLGDEIQLNKTNTTDKVGTLTYNLTSERENQNKKYIGKITSNIKLEKNANGSFSNNEYHAKIVVSNLTIK